MEVILLERVSKLGQMGETVRVKNGFARNYLLPKRKALRATKENLERFENERTQLEARNLELKKEADTVAEALNNNTFVVIRQAGETGQLYGSVSSRDVAEILTENGFTISRNQASLLSPIKTIGFHSVQVTLHPEVEVTLSLNVARSTEEAERQAKGEILLGRDKDSSSEQEDKGEDESPKEGEQTSDSAANNDSDSEKDKSSAKAKDKKSDGKAKSTSKTKKEKKTKAGSDESEAKPADESEAKPADESTVTESTTDSADVKDDADNDSPSDSDAKDDSVAEATASSDSDNESEKKSN